MGTNGHGLDADDSNQEATPGDGQEYDLMVLLERLESLEEDMVELGMTTLDDVRQRIAQLHEQLGED